jgi:hypothetical protein
MGYVPIIISSVRLSAVTVPVRPVIVYCAKGAPPIAVGTILSPLIE